VLDQTLQRFPSQVEPVETGVAVFQPGHQPKGMRIVIEAANVARGIIESFLACMAEGGMSQIVRKAEGLGEVFVDGQQTRNGPRNLRHFQRMGETRPVIIPLILDEDLGLVLQASKSGGMNDPIPVPLITGSGGAFRLGEQAAAAVNRPARIGRAHGRGLKERRQKTTGRSFNSVQGLCSCVAAAYISPETL